MGAVMVPGRELDALVAERVMGWVRCSAWQGANLGSAGGFVGMNHGCEHARGTCFPADDSVPWPHFSTDIAAAWEVVEKMRKDGWGMTVDSLGFPGEEWRAWFQCDVSHDYLKMEIGEAATAPHAICLTALKAVGAL